MDSIISTKLSENGITQEVKLKGIYQPPEVFRILMLSEGTSTIQWTNSHNSAMTMPFCSSIQCWHPTVSQLQTILQYMLLRESLTGHKSCVISSSDFFGF